MQITNMDSEDSLVKLGGTKYKITVWDEEEYTENNLAINEIRYSQETNENGITSINFENAHALRTMIYRLEEIKLAKAYVKNELKPVFTIKINKSDLYETKIFNDNVFKATSQIKNGDGGYSEPEEERLSTNMVKNYAEIGFKTKHVSQVLLYTIYEKTGEEYTERGKIEVAFDEYGNVIDQKTSGRYIANTTYSPNTNYVNAYIKTETFRIGVKVESTNREADYSLAGYTFDIKNSKGEQSDLTIKTNSIGDVIEIIGEVYKGETITYNIKQAKNAIDYEPAKEVTLTVVFNEDGTIASCSPVTQEGKYDLVTTIKNKDTKANMSNNLYFKPI